MNDAAGHVAPLERVQLAPVITYRGANDRDRSLKDATGAGYRFDAGKDFALAGNPQGAVTVPQSGRVKLEMSLDKLETSDGVPSLRPVPAAAAGRQATAPADPLQPGQRGVPAARAGP